MLIAALVFAALAAVLHVYIFVMESVRWTNPATRKTFGISEQEAVATKEMAFNQGFYNLFLAIMAVVGIVVAAAGHHGIGVALILAGCGSMLAAGLVLLISSPSMARAAITQLAFPLIAVILAVIWALI